MDLTRVKLWRRCAKGSAMKSAIRAQLAGQFDTGAHRRFGQHTAVYLEQQVFTHAPSPCIDQAMPCHHYSAGFGLRLVIDPTGEPRRVGPDRGTCHRLSAS